ncbi:hypothetical protein AX27061_0473 [Achromobacter xylosoxidans NBRC 15126 = ATCC 27061]|nr:hypothetical protein AX27061_0473 [Achromobacter xylosoxidans NBRC 15126 = ATCC 27061]
MAEAGLADMTDRAQIAWKKTTHAPTPDGPRTSGDAATYLTLNL